MEPEYCEPGRHVCIGEPLCRKPVEAPEAAQEVAKRGPGRPKREE